MEVKSACVGFSERPFAASERFLRAIITLSLICCCAAATSCAESSGSKDGADGLLGPGCFGGGGGGNARTDGLSGNAERPRKWRKLQVSSGASISAKSGGVGRQRSDKMRPHRDGRRPGPHAHLLFRASGKQQDGHQRKNAGGQTEMAKGKPKPQIFLGSHAASGNSMRKVVPRPASDLKSMEPL